MVAKVHRVLRGRQERLAYRGLKGQLGPVLKARQELPGRKALRAPLVLKVPKAHRATKAFKGTPGPKALKVTRGSRVTPGPGCRL